MFAILGPDGEERHTRTGRSPLFAFGRDEKTAVPLMGRTMQRLARRYARKGASKKDDLALPTHPDLRIALNVAACDDRPLVVAFHSDKRELAKLEAGLRDVAWHASAIGRGEYVLVESPIELHQVKELRTNAQSGIYVLRPGRFGEFGTVLAHIPPGFKDNATLRTHVVAALDEYTPYNKERQQHVRTGGRLGVKWKTAIPVTDSHATGNGRRRGRRR